MRIKTVFQFQFGNGEAIREVAKSRSALWVGMILVLLTAIARSYDQTFILEKPLLWLFGPLLFSLGSASLIFCFIYPTFIRRHLAVERAGFAAQFRSFLSLFWMTAPIAWLYAIPVERFLPSYQAAQANLALLALVAFWRILLLARVFSVVQETPLWRTLLWVLIPASIEVIALYIFGGAFAKAIMEGMSGMRNSPEEKLLLKSMAFSAVAAFWVAIAAILLVVIFRNRVSFQSFPNQQADRLPTIGLVALAIFWVSVAIYPQIQVNRNFRVEQLMTEGKHKEALQFLSAHEEKDFAPARELPPKPYEYDTFEDLPKTVEAMDGTEKEWVRQKYFRYLEIMITHKTYFGIDRSFEPLKQNLKRIPDGADWLKRNEKKFSGFVQQHQPDPPTQPTNSIPLLNITNSPAP